MEFDTTARFIDCDSHITEPPDLWTSRVSKKWGDLVPRVERHENPRWNFSGNRKEVTTGEQEVWIVGDRVVAGAATTAGGRWSEPLPALPRTYDDIVPAAY